MFSSFIHIVLHISILFWFWLLLFCICLLVLCFLCLFVFNGKSFYLISLALPPPLHSLQYNKSGISQIHLFFTPSILVSIIFFFFSSPGNYPLKDKYSHHLVAPVRWRKRILFWVLQSSAFNERGIHLWRHTHSKCIPLLFVSTSGSKIEESSSQKHLQIPQTQKRQTTPILFTSGLTELEKGCL